MFAQPQRHRDTEKTQSHPPTKLFNAKTQRRKDAKAARPLRFQRRGAETQRRREAHARLHCAARFRPSNDGREPLGRATAPIASDHRGVPAQRPALSKRRPRPFSSSFNSLEGYASLPNEIEERQNRCAAGAAAGEKPGSDGCLHPERRDFSPAIGDHPIACRSAANPRHHLPSSATVSLRLCAFASLRFLRWGDGSALICVICGFFGCAGGSAPLRLCASAPLRFLLCVLLCASVPLWFSRCLGDPPGSAGGKFEIRNSKFEIS